MVCYLANRNRNQKNNRRRDNYKSPNKVGKKNYQDRLAIREFNKGMRDAESDVSGRQVRPVEGPNDWSWYNPNNQLLRDVTSVPFATLSGRPITNHWHYVNQNVGGTKADLDIAAQVIPGVMSLKVMPTVGLADNNLDPINIAGAQLYSQLQVKSGRTPSYDMADVMKTIVASGDAYSFYIWASRVYGTVNRYEVLNQYTPRALIEAMGVDFDDLRKNIADYRTGLNQLAYRLAMLPVPKQMTFFSRRVFMYQGIYKDSTTSKAQYYMFNPVGFYMYQEGPDSPVEGQSALSFVRMVPDINPDNGNRLVEHPVSSTYRMKHDEIIRFGNKLIDTLLLSEDVRMITADIINTFGPDAFFEVHPIGETFEVVPEYSKEVLMQIENSFILPHMINIYSTIVENTAINAGNLVATYKYYSYYDNVKSGAASTLLPGNYNLFNGIASPANQVVLNVHDMDSPTPEDVMVMTRLSSNGYVNYVNGDETTQTYFTLSQMGSEVLIGGELYYYTNVNNTNTLDLRVMPFSSNMIALPERLQVPVLGTSSTEQQNVPGIFELNQTISMLAKFDWHPQVKIAYIREDDPTQNTKKISITSGTWDLDNFTTISGTLLQNINRVALEGLFAIR